MLKRRSAAATGLRKCGMLHVARWLTSYRESSLAVFAYHRIANAKVDDPLESDVELVSASTAAFERQMRFVKDNFTPLSCADLISHLYRGTRLPPRSAIVTFDDGFEDNYTNAFPVLKRLGMPATFFVVTGCIDTGAPFWFERVAYAILNTREHIQLPNGSTLDPGRPYAARISLAHSVLRGLMLMDDGRRRGAVAALLEESKCAADSLEKHRPMNWAQVAEMKAAGMEFGSHTVTHPVLTRLSDVDLMHELRASRLRLEEILGCAADSLAYPVGGAEAYDERVRQAALSAGYRLGMCYEPGVNKKSALGVLALRRIPVERYIDDDLFKAMSLLPQIFVR